MNRRRPRKAVSKPLPLKLVWAAVVLTALCAQTSLIPAESEPATLPVAQEGTPEPKTPTPTDQPTPETPTDPEQLLEAALNAMDLAALELEADVSTEKAVQDQERAVELLHKLLASASSSPKPSPSQPSPSSDDSPDKQSSDAKSAESNSSGGRRSDDENSKESSENVAGPTQSSDSPLIPKSRGNSVWGHLPKREQESLLRSLSDNFLPEYEAQIKRYYEALAEGKPGTGGR